MKTTIITESVEFKILETTTDEQLLSKADTLNDFQKKQEGFIDVELVKHIQENAWCLIYHFESMEKVKAIGEKLRNSIEFGEFVALTVPGSISVNLYHRLRNW